MKKIDYASLFTMRKDGRYQTQITLPTGKVKYFYSRSPEDLYNQVQTFKAGSLHTFAELLDEWASIHQEETEPGTWKNYVPHIADLKMLYGKLPPEKITAQLINTDLLRQKARGYSATVVRTRRSLFSMSLTHGVIIGLLQYNPAKDVRLPKGLPHSHRTAPTEEEVQTIFASVSQPFGLFAFFCLCTGLRKGEALALLWSDVNLKRREIYVTKSIDYSQSTSGRIKCPKTEAGNRVVHIVDVLLPFLEDARCADDKPVFPAPASNRGGRGGGYMTSRNFDGAWERYCKATGLTLTAHQLRHGTATLLFESGADVKYAQKMLGHASAQITQEVYTDLRIQQQSKSDAAFNAKMSAYFPEKGKK